MVYYFNIKLCLFHNDKPNKYIPEFIWFLLCLFIAASLLKTLPHSSHLTLCWLMLWLWSAIAEVKDSSHNSQNIPEFVVTPCTFLWCLFRCSFLEKYFLQIWHWNFNFLSIWTNLCCFRFSILVKVFLQTSQPCGFSLQ